MAAELEYSARVQLRWRDMDMLGHLNQSVYHELLEEGRAGIVMELSRRLGGGGRTAAFVLVHVDLDYHHEVRKHDEEVVVAVRVVKVGTSSVTLAHEVRLTDGRVAASGQTVLVAWDPVARTKRALSETELAMLGAGS